jgi:hypothetical protein
MLLVRDIVDALLQRLRQTEVQLLSQLLRLTQQQVQGLP